MNVPELFGSMVFNESAMQAFLPQDTYQALKRTIAEGLPLDLAMANEVAAGMKDWALERGATHYTHWFHPLTGITAEKHMSFISPVGDGRVIMEFSGKELIRGESDASSFPSGGLRATFEARGYTAWDPTSYAFVREGSLFIPTAFCSHGGGEALDKKTPLLRSMEAISASTRRILRLFGHEASHVTTTVGPEQEYFLVDRKYYYERKDLTYTGRTLFGAPPPKAQELDDHYYGFIKTRVSAYMKDLDEELWKLGILAKTEHNEVAPGQHEFAPIFTTANMSTDHDQLTMEIMRKVAGRHDLACLLHEKPFAGVNGSGKHVNWAMATVEGTNLLEPGSSPAENAQFLLFLAAVIKAVDTHQDLLRISVASAGNDLRLGQQEAPPAIISMYIGEELEAILEAIELRRSYNPQDPAELRVGVDVLPAIPKETTDRNRTSPFAFTGDKFEFRMPGAAASIAEPVTVLNTIVADALAEFADELEGASDFEAALTALIGRVITAHKRILFSGNGYDRTWVEEAAQRGLLNLETTADALPHMTTPKNIALFEKHGIYSRAELYARQEILLESYCKILKIEAVTMIEMARRDILPAVMGYGRDLAETIAAKRAVFPALACETEGSLLTQISGLTDEVYGLIGDLQNVISAGGALDCFGSPAAARHFKAVVIPAMENLRRAVDALEVITSKASWPYPSYGRLIYLN
ncbi:MAG: glutamine synthetase III [Oscillospiraceae bacterium]|nr:glutamine synthetase III [Oscillospiraceae bacterium]